MNQYRSRLVTNGIPITELTVFVKAPCPDIAVSVKQGFVKIYPTAQCFSYIAKQFIEIRQEPTVETPAETTPAETTEEVARPAIAVKWKRPFAATVFSTARLSPARFRVI